MSDSSDFYKEEAKRYLQEGYEKQLQGQLNEAMGLYRKSIDVFPMAEAYTYLGWAYSFKNQYAEAIEECHKAIALDPEFGNRYNDIGAYLIEIGKSDEAVSWFEKAIGAKRYESYCYPYYNLGRVWEHKGDWIKALEYYQKAVQENADYNLARHAVARLQGMMN